MIFDWFIIAVENALRIILAFLPDMGTMPEVWEDVWIFLASSFAGMVYLFPDSVQFDVLFVLQSVLWTEIAIFGYMLYEKVIRFFRG